MHHNKAVARRAVRQSNETETAARSQWQRRALTVGSEIESWTVELEETG
jgi:hypothetical protein